MAEFEFLNTMKEFGGVFKLGSGVLGKSAIALGGLLVSVVIAVARLHSDSSIIAVIVIGTFIFFGWFGLVLKFAGDHPDAALLEGAEWSGYQRFQATAKGYIPKEAEKEPTELLGSTRLIEIGDSEKSKRPDEDPVK